MTGNILKLLWNEDLDPFTLHVETLLPKVTASGNRASGKKSAALLVALVTPEVRTKLGSPPSQRKEIRLAGTSQSLEL